jgi:glycosyltransferase involved in cell wall biosynthesis
MHIVFFTHPPFLGSQSMPRFATMLAKGMERKGHTVEISTPEAFFYKLPVPQSMKKWMGYLDQYLVFPAQVNKRLKQYPADTLFVFTDHALGPWVPLVAKRPHVIHCHDFLAQQAALSPTTQNAISFTGKKYQQFIRRGYQKGKNFVSVSDKTRNDLHQMLGSEPDFSEMVYNGLNQDFKPQDVRAARALVAGELNINTANGYILHIGGNQWYKNRTGVIQIYNAWRNKYKSRLPLIMLGVAPNQKIVTARTTSPYKNDIYIHTGKSDSCVKNAYAGATMLLFPSLAEGFGWPIAEAMASGCPVITTNEAPMTEVAGNAGFLINKRPCNQPDTITWAYECAKVVNMVVNLSPEEREDTVKKGIINANRFRTETMLNNIEDIYIDIVNSYSHSLNKTTVLA